MQKVEIEDYDDFPYLTSDIDKKAFQSGDAKNISIFICIPPKPLIPLSKSLKIAILEY